MRARAATPLRFSGGVSVDMLTRRRVFAVDTMPGVYVVTRFAVVDVLRLVIRAIASARRAGRSVDSETEDA